MLEGSLAVRPKAWNERYRADLGIVPLVTVTGCCRTCIGTAA